MVVRAFDGTRREVRGEIDHPVQIGPHTCQVTFQIMDINPAYRLLKICHEYSRYNIDLEYGSKMLPICSPLTNA